MVKKMFAMNGSAKYFYMRPLLLGIWFKTWFINKQSITQSKCVSYLKVLENLAENTYSKKKVWDQKLIFQNFPWNSELKQLLAVNPFPFHTPLKTLEKLSFSGVFRGNKMGTLSKNEFILVFFSIQQFQVILHVTCHILERWFENKPDY